MVGNRHGEDGPDLLSRTRYVPMRLREPVPRDTSLITFQCAQHEISVLNSAVLTHEPVRSVYLAVLACRTISSAAVPRKTKTDSELSDRMAVSCKRILIHEGHAPKTKKSMP